MYSLRQLLKQEPSAVKEFVTTVLGTLVLMGVIDVSKDVIVGSGILISVLLGLFYVRPLTSSKDAINQLSVLQPLAAKAKAAARKK